MLYVLEQIFGVMSKLVEHILDWPFLLFIFLVWTITRFRDQIGSMLDRRSAPGSEGLPRKVRKELAGFENTIGKLNSDISDLQSQMRRVEDVQSLDRFERSLKPLRTATKDLEINFKSIENQLVQLAGRGIHEKIAEMLVPISAQMDRIPEEIRRLEDLITSRPEREDLATIFQEVESLKSEIIPVKQELENIRNSLDGKVSLESYGAAVSKIENLQVELVKISGNVNELNEKTGTLVETGQFDALKSEMSVFDSRLGRLSAGIESLKSELQSAEAQLKSSASAESVDKLVRDLKNNASSIIDIERKLDSYRIEEEFGRFSSELAGVKKLADVLSNSFNSAPWNESAVETRNLVLSIQARVDGISNNLETLNTQNSGSPGSEALVKMLEDSGIMRFEINKLKESVESAIANKADASVQAETVSSELARISSEIETLKEGLRTLPLLQEVHGSPPKAKKKKK